MRLPYFNQRICTFSIALLRHNEKCFCIGNYPSKVIQFCEFNNVLWFLRQHEEFKVQLCNILLIVSFFNSIIIIEMEKISIFIIFKVV